MSAFTGQVTEDSAGLCLQDYMASNVTDFELLQSIWSPGNDLGHLPSVVCQSASDNIIRDYAVQDTLPSVTQSVSLPPHDEIEILLDGYFRGFHPIFPVFREVTLRSLIRQTSLPKIHLDAGSWACAYMVIAISYKLQLWHKPAADYAARAARLYFNAAMRLLSDIIMETSRRNIQALALMSVFLRGSMHFNNASSLLGAAISQACSHDIFAGSCPEDILEDRLIYNVLYILDKEYEISELFGRPFWMVVLSNMIPLFRFSLQLGLPPTMKTAHSMGAQLANNENGEENFNRLRSFCSLAKLEEQIYLALFSRNAQQESPERLLHLTSDLDQRLETWKVRHALMVGACVDCSDDGPQYCGSCVLLHLMYNNCAIVIHRLEVIHCPYTGLLSNVEPSSPLFSLIASSARKRHEAALSSIRIVQRLHPGDGCPFWLIPSYIIETVFVFLMSIILDSEDVHTQQHIKAMDTAVAIIQLVHARSGGEFGQLVRVASGTAYIAKQISSKRKYDAVSNRISQVSLESAVRELHRGLRPRAQNRKKAQLAVDTPNGRTAQVCRTPSMIAMSRSLETAPVAAAATPLLPSCGNTEPRCQSHSYDWNSGPGVEAAFANVDINWENFISDSLML